jgi:hypothetical protein
MLSYWLEPIADQSDIELYGRGYGRYDKSMGVPWRRELFDRVESLSIVILCIAPSPGLYLRVAAAFTSMARL